ncbi:MAG: pectate lyase [Chitinophagaceae bacterium]
MKRNALHHRKNKITPIALAYLLMICWLPSMAQEVDKKDNGLSDLSWGQVATKMPDEWYASAEARNVAENVLFCQQDIGGWQKNKPYHHTLSEAEKDEFNKSRSGIGATIDNGATTTEMMFLAKIYSKQKDERYWKSFNKGFNYLLDAQYKNGGWPQFYPSRGTGGVSYSSHITYNDNAMVNVMKLLRDIADGAPLYAQLPISNEMRQKAGASFDKGIQCILKTQIKVDGKPTVWCAQHDEVTFLPANARAYELASFSGGESVGIIQLLMDIQKPSTEIVTSVKDAMIWLDMHKITGLRVTREPDATGKRNTVVQKDDNAPVLLARFYDLQTGTPFFCDRDGIKKSSLAEIGPERRNGYSWYYAGYGPLQTEYNKWLKKWNLN